MGFAWESPKLSAAMTRLGLTVVSYTPGYVTYRCPHCREPRDVATQSVYRWAKLGLPVPHCRRAGCPTSPPPSTPTPPS